MTQKVRGGRSRWLLLVTVVTALLAAGCGGGGGASSTTGAGSGEVDLNANLRIAYPVAQTLSPIEAPEPAQLLISGWPVYERLLQVSPDAAYEPMLATKWEFSGNGKKLTLTLRDDVTFSDGTPFDADAVKANLDAYRAADGTAVQLNVSMITGVKVVDPLTVVVKLKQPSTTILSSLASTQGGAMVSPKALSSPDLGTNPVGTGPYVIESFQPGQKVTYTRRTDEDAIWDDKAGKPARVEISTLGNDDSLVNAIKAGQSDLVVWSSEPTPFQAEIDSGKLVNYVMGDVLNMVGLSFNTKMAPYDDPAVRQAINYAVDREGIIKAFAPDSATRVQPWPDRLPGFDPELENAYPFDPDKAKQVLADAGYTGEIDGGELLVADRNFIPKAAEVIQANLADVGINIKIRTMEVYSVVTEWAKGQYPIDMMYMSEPSIDPYTWINRLFFNPVWSPDGVDPKLAKLAEGIDNSTMSEEDREAKVSEVIAYATEQAKYVPLWQGVGGFVATAKVKGISDDELASVNGGVADLRNTYIVK